MTLSVKVYGFGSAFSKFEKPNDIDLLIVHADALPPSCEFAIACKRWLMERLANADVTMLSQSEAAHFGFIETARAICLGTVRKVQMERDLMTVLTEIQNARRSDLQCDFCSIDKIEQTTAFSSGT